MSNPNEQKNDTANSPAPGIIQISTSPKQNQNIPLDYQKVPTQNYQTPQTNQQTQVYQGQPQMYQGQPQMYQGQPQMIQGQPQMYQGQPQMIQGQPQIYAGQPQMYAGQPQMYPGQPQMYPGQPANQFVYQGYQNQPQIAGVQPIFVQPVLLPIYEIAGGPCDYVTDPLAELANCISASVRQKFEFLETITGCETPNRYYVIGQNQLGQKKYLFKAKEESNCCCRQFCSGNSREFKLFIDSMSLVNGVEVKKLFATFERPYKCTCFCCARPTMAGKLVGDTQDVGKIKEPFKCCDPHIKVYNRHGDCAFSISCNCCQCGYCCRNNSLGKCSEVFFEIYRGSVILEKGKACGMIHKKFKGMKSVIGDADFFDITFPSDACAEEKFLLITAVIMMDYLYYEDKNDFCSGGGRRSRHRSRTRSRPRHHHH